MQGVLFFYAAAGCGGGCGLFGQERAHRVGNRFAVDDLREAVGLRAQFAELRRHDFAHQRRISFEYIVFRGVNDTPAHVAALTRLLAGLRCRINLIRFHAIPDAPFEGADEPTMVRLRDELSRRGITTTIRASRGEDIQAACGLLSTLRQGNGSPAGRKESPEASGSEPHETSSDARCGTTIAPERTEPDNKKTKP